MHCCHFVPIWRNEVSSAAQSRTPSLNRSDILPRVALLESGETGACCPLLLPLLRGLESRKKVLETV